MAIQRLVAAASAAVAAALALTGAANTYDLFYTDAGLCDPVNGSFSPDCHPSEIPQLNLKVATFDATGKLLNNVNVSNTLYNGMGYLSLSKDGSTLLFASEDESPDGIVRTYTLDLTNPTAQPVIILDDLTNLMAPCAPTCVSASTFHAYWSADSSQIYFAYRVWDMYGNGIGSQAIAVANADGSNIKPLTWTNAGPDEGLNIIDMCPSPVASDTGRLLFVRTTDQGASNYLAEVDIATGNSTQLLQLDQYADSSGCPNPMPTADGRTSIVMLCNAASGDCGFGARQAALGKGVAVTRKDSGLRWGRVPAVVSAVRSSVPASWYNYYASVTQAVGVDPASWTASPMFEVPFVNSTDYLDTYGITQCDAIKTPSKAGSVGTEAALTLTCQGADHTHDTFYRTFVNAATGNTTAASYNTLLACMTARCTVMAQN